MIARLQFNRREFAGAFGDIGTSLPIIVGVLLTTGLNCSGVLIAFGCAQIFTGLLYGLPMPVQPLKAMAVVVIAGQASGALLQMAGLMIGGLMLVLSASGGSTGSVASFHSAWCAVCKLGWGFRSRE